MKDRFACYLLLAASFLGGCFSQRPHSTIPEPVLIRIVPLSTTSTMPYQSGFLEVFRNGGWLRVCSHNWGSTEDSVACGNLGFPEFAPVTPRQELYRLPWDPTQLIDIRVMNVDCDGTEGKLSECSQTIAPFNQFCLSGKAVILNCKSKAASNIRLRGGALFGEGRVQVAFDGNYGGICGNEWDIKDGHVACRQLGLGTAKRTYRDAEFGQVHTVVWYTDVACQGTEKSIDDCPKVHPEVTNYLNYTSPGCSIRQQASVVCHTPDTGARNTIALEDGLDSTVGRVTVQVGGVWGSVCADTWRMSEAMVVCRQLGLGYASRALKNASHLTGSGRRLDIVMANVLCNGHESSLSECSHRAPWRYGDLVNCGSKWTENPTYVGVVCTRDGLPDLQLDIPELQDSISIDVQPLWNLLCAAEENCLAPTANSTGNNDEVRTLMRLTVNVWNRGSADFLPWQVPSEWEWHACHAHYHSMAEFAHYDILSATTLDRVAEGHKVSFCLSDSMCVGDKTPSYQCNETPERSQQGISVGCSDIYFAWFDCQWLDITDVDPGDYFLRVSLNPQHLVAELDVYNNDVRCDITYDGENVSVKSCLIADDLA